MYIAPGMNSSRWSWAEAMSFKFSADLKSRIKEEYGLYFQLDALDQLENSDGVLQNPIGLQAHPTKLQVGVSVR